MKAEMYYRETYPKELRIQIENEDELNMLYLMFHWSPENMLKRFKEDELDEAGLSATWRKNFIKNSNNSDNTQYETYEVFKELEQEKSQIKFEEASENS
jgi:hypothetical protein